MEIIAECNISLLNIILINIVSKLIGILTNTRHLYCSTEIHIVLALMICEYFKLILCEVWSIVDDLVINRLSSGNISFMWYQIEIKDLISLVFHNRSINNSSLRRVKDIPVFLWEKPCLCILVHKAINSLRAVIFSVLFKWLHDCRHFTVIHLLHESGAAYSVSVHYDELRQDSVVVLLIIA